MTIKKLLGFVFFLLVVGILGVVGTQWINSGHNLEEFQLAVIGPMDHEHDAGNSFYRAAQLLIDENKKNFEQQGFKIVLRKFNDKNDKRLARELASKIGQDNLILGTIGHNYSSVSLAAAELYKDAKIPVISPTSTNINVTKDNDWFFRTIFNDEDQGQFLGYYSKLILKKSHAVIIKEDLPYGSLLAREFETSAESIGLRIRASHTYSTSKEKFDQDLATIITSLKGLNKTDLIFISGHYQEGIKLVRMLRDEQIENLILTPDSYSHPSFISGFSALPKEIERPGYYSNGLLVAMPILYESANAKAQAFYQGYISKYGEEPDWRAAYAYDAMLLFVSAIERTSITGTGKSTADKRAVIKNYLQSMSSPAQSVEGVTGLNYFDDSGNSSKPITIGKYKNTRLAPALTQLSPIGDIKDIPDLREAIKEESVVKFGNRYMYKTNIVYTGVELNKIKDIDLETSTFTADFDVWFRYGGSVDVRDIEFLNAEKPIQLKMPIEEIQLGKRLYRRYKITGRLQMNSFHPSGPNRHVFGVSFVHKSLPRDNLIFIIDTIGGADVSVLASERTKTIFPQDFKWFPQVSWSQQGVYHRKILGNINHIDKPANTISYSQFMSGTEVAKSSFDLQSELESNRIAYVLIVICIATGLLFQRKVQLINRFYWWIRFSNKQRRSEYPISQNRRRAGYSYYLPHSEEKPKKYRRRSTDPLITDAQGWWFTSLAMIVALYAAESVATSMAFTYVDSDFMGKIIQFFYLMWWFVPAYITASTVRRFFWRFVEQKSRREVPEFIKMFLTFLIYSLMVLGIIAFVYDQKITSIIGTSGIFLMIIGLAVQMNISNVVAGLVLNMEKSINIGDWVIIGDMKEGKVIEMNWRTTKIMTRNDVILNIPNNTISEVEFTNFSSPKNLACLWHFIDLEQNVPYEKARNALLTALNNVPEVVDPIVSFNTFTHWSAKYLIMYSIEDYGARFRIKKVIWEETLKCLEKSNIRIASMKFDDSIIRE